MEPKIVRISSVYYFGFSFIVRLSRLTLNSEDERSDLRRTAMEFIFQQATMLKIATK